MVSADTLGIATAWNPPVLGKHEVTRLGGTCYKFKQQPNNNTPSGSTPSPRGRPIRQRRSSLELSTSPDISDEEISRQVAIDTAVHDGGSPYTSFGTNFVDFNALIRSKYPGQLDYKLLEECKMYNSRCLNIISTSHRDLAVSIANENAQFAIRLIDYFNNPSTTNSSSTPYSNLPPRRRRRFDYSVGTDSGTDGEDNNMLLKVPRISFPYIEHENASNTSALANETESIQHNMIGGAGNLYNTAGPSIPSEPNVSSALPSKIQDLSYGLDPKVANLKRDEKHHESSKRFSSAQMNLSEFVTPLATLKMQSIRGVSPNGDESCFADPSFPVMRLDALNAFDPISSNIDEDCILSYAKRNSLPGPFCDSHFSFNLEHLPAHTNAMKDFYKWISNTNSKELDSNWIISHIPRFLKISGQDLKDQFVLNKSMSCQVFDAAIRRFKELDSVIYQPLLPLRWRHLLESDYTRHILGSEHPADKNTVLEQFVGKSVDYEVSRCRMFFLPMFGSGSWWCYSWDLDSSAVYIIDPTAASSKDDVIIRKHSQTIHQQSGALNSTITDHFNRWVPNFAPSRFEVVRIAGMPYSSKVSGLLTLFCIWNFDGSKVSSNANLENIASFKAFLLSQILVLEDNKGRLPTSFTMKLQ